MKPSLLALLLGFALCGSSAFAAADKPNVLFIAVDDLRPNLGCYGNRVVKTPNIDRLAARGLVFEHAYCQQAVCSPTRSSLLTGRRPDATKVWDLETHFRVALPDAVTLPQYFKEHGYYCASLSKIYHHGFEDGGSWSEPAWFPSGETVDTDPSNPLRRIVKHVSVGATEHGNNPQPADNDKPAAGKGKGGGKGPAFEVSTKSDDELPDGLTAVEAIKRLHELKSKGKPFFLGVGFLKPHLPFIAPKKYWDLYDPSRIPVPAIDHLPEGAPDFAGHKNGELHGYAGVPKENPIPEEFAKQLRHGYYACTSYTDALVGRVLDALDKEGLADNTVVVLWGDHGWQLGEHGLWHKHTNFEVATRVPLIISLPEQKTAGQKCEATVEFVDLYPTLAEVCGLPAPAGLDGTSLKPWIDNPLAPASKVAISQFPRSGNLMGYSIRDDRWRLTLWREQKTGKIAATELYDEKNDPDETKSVPASNPEVVARLSKFVPAFDSAHPTTAGNAPKNAAKGPANASLAEKKSAPVPAKDGKQDRTAMFENRDANHDGKLTLEEFLSKLSDTESAKERFNQWDTNKDGFLSLEEFVRIGGK